MTEFSGRMLVFCRFTQGWCDNGNYCFLDRTDRAGDSKSAALCEEGFVMPFYDKENQLPFGARGTPRRDYE